MMGWYASLFLLFTELLCRGKSLVISPMKKDVSFSVSSLPILTWCPSWLKWSLYFRQHYFKSAEALTCGRVRQVLSYLICLDRPDSLTALWEHSYHVPFIVPFGSMSDYCCWALWRHTQGPAEGLSAGHQERIILSWQAGGAQASSVIIPEHHHPQHPTRCPSIPLPFP